MKKYIYTFLLLCLFIFQVTATHNRAGEITYKQISGLTYEITVTTFTYRLSQADRSELEVGWGDNTSSIAPRDPSLIIQLPNYYQRNIYFARHTFPGPGTYQILVQDPNRNFGVKNIPNSVNTIFSIKTTLIISPLAGNNSTPVLLNPPIDRAAMYHVFIHNPGAYDVDGDSISYSLAICTEENGKPIVGYTFPLASDSLYVDPYSGDLVWNAPIDSGIYNIAMNITEWRKGIKIGNIVRDMQIDVYKTTNNPPVNQNIMDYCLVAGQKLDLNLTSSDPDLDSVYHTFTGGPLIIDNGRMVIGKSVAGKGTRTTQLSWQTNCKQVRLQPYTLIVKATDDNAKLSLVDIDRINIRVISPPVKELKALAGNQSVRLSWKPPLECSNIVGYEIYRTNIPSVWVPDSCQTGIPSGFGFIKVGETKNLTDTVFEDNNSGKGLQQGLDYCYRVIALFPDGAKSIASEEICVSLIPGFPSITNVSVMIDDNKNGSIFLSWAMPRGLDTIPANGPFEYRIYRSNDLWGTIPELIHSFNTTDLTDTTYIDKGLNTIAFPYSYKIEMYNNEPNNRFLLGNPETASSFYPDIKSKDNTLSLKFMANVPWLNTEYTIYRKPDWASAYDSLTTVYTDSYIDDSLKNLTEYCYRIKSKGWRKIDNRMYSTENISHINCGIPEDNEPPCPPFINVKANCDSSSHTISWHNQPDACSEDVIKYQLYYTPTLRTDLKPLYAAPTRTDTLYVHFPELSMAGCYAVTAIDSFDNESVKSTMICIDECTDYKLPNVFTPNGDGDNDLFRPSNYRFVERVDMKIYNRWGNLIFETADPMINWNGAISGGNKMASPGIYYYICDVFENRLSGLEARSLTGFVYLFTDKNSSVPND